MYISENSLVIFWKTP